MPRKKQSFDQNSASGANSTKLMPVQIPETYVALPVRNSVFFPRQVLPLSVGREKSLRVLEEAQREQLPIVILAQRDSSIENPHGQDLHTMGTHVRILKVFNLPDGTKSVLVQGVARTRVLSFLQDEPYIKVIGQQVHDEPNQDADIDGTVTAVKKAFQQIVELSPELNEEHLSMILNIEKAGAVADIATSLVNASLAEKQDVLETLPVKERIKKVHTLLSRILNKLEIGDKIRSEVQEEINKNQREYVLREQLKAINKELGEENEQVEVKEFRKRMENTPLPDDVRKTLEKEIGRLSKINSASAEYSVARTYIEWLLDLPWMISTTDTLEVANARTVLEHDHYGLDKVKNRILEYLAVRKLKNDMRGPILCFVGPPGVGKTSLGRSIANALGRKFIRISLGGIHDEAELRGHRRTYVGALPGRIIQGLKKAGSNNPVFMLDEIDKVGRDFRGDPSAALLEVLDPEQNSSFSDHYIEQQFDLSKVLFIATANMLDPIPGPLRDRMEIVEIPSYVEEEKLHIAKQYLIPKQIIAHGLSENAINFQDDAIRKIIHSYTREAGVRNLERNIANVCRGIAKDVAEGKSVVVSITAEMIAKYLGKEKFFSEIAERINKPGIATGLAWTPVGGDILFIEATRMKGKGQLMLTGQLGDVMKESAHAALSYIAANAEKLGVDESFREKNDIHVHFPAGAIPKDGPSAGVTILTALTSILTGQIVRNDVAMTGEITLRGAVLPVGGIREKVLAAHRAGLKTIILPERNKVDLDEIPKGIVDTLLFHFVKDMEEVLKVAFSQQEEKVLVEQPDPRFVSPISSN